MGVVTRRRDCRRGEDQPATGPGDSGALKGREFSPDPRPEAGSFFRSDHFPFAKVGVPAISFRSGEDLEKGGVAAGKAASAEYNERRYHQPGDEWSPAWDLSGAAQDTELLYTIGRDMANSRRWPEWEQGRSSRRSGIRARPLGVERRNAHTHGPQRHRGRFRRGEPRSGCDRREVLVASMVRDAWLSYRSNDSRRDGSRQPDHVRSGSFLNISCSSGRLLAPP